MAAVLCTTGVRAWSQVRDDHARTDHGDRGDHGDHGHDIHGPVAAHGPASRDAPGYHGDINHFHEHDWAVWHAGHWEHGPHGARHGWWWVAGGLWYFYPSPIYPVPNPYEPPPTIIDAPTPVDDLPPPPMPTSWYYCNSAQAYYPYVDACPEGWRAVPATPAPAPPGTPQ